MTAPRSGSCSFRYNVFKRTLYQAEINRIQFVITVEIRRLPFLQLGIRHSQQPLLQQHNIGRIKFSVCIDIASELLRLNPRHDRRRQKDHRRIAVDCIFIGCPFRIAVHVALAVILGKLPVVVRIRSLRHIARRTSVRIELCIL